jgi:hypothetical protein
VRCSFDTTSTSLRWPRAQLVVDAEGLVVRGPEGELARAPWEDVAQVVRCGYVLRGNVRIVPEDGPRFVVGGPKVAAHVAEHLPDHLPLRLERRQGIPWMPKDAASGLTDRFPGRGRRT